MANRFYNRPENAISKADEFINVGKHLRALETLYDVIKSKKRYYNAPEKLIEQIMYKYLELCVDLKKSQVAKEGLFQYRNMCQSTNVASLAAVVQGYLNMAEKRTEEAKLESTESVTKDVDDLENLATPEMIILSAVSGEDAQDRSDRKILMPWVKFLWESYCQCLELLRTNSRVERLYHDIAQQAFKFCLKYQRKTEFRKLCEKLRNHVDLILKQTSSNATINLSNPDTQQMNLDTRLVQLDSAIHMELWQEAYKAVEDIHGLMTLSKKVFHPKMMANYYQKLALVFWKSGNQLFHAAALFKHLQLSRELKKTLSAEELAKSASRVLMAALAVPVPSQHPEFDRFVEKERTPQEKMHRLAVLLGLPQAPTRQTLLKDLVRFGVIPAAHEQLQSLHKYLEVEFGPLTLCRKVEKIVLHIQETPELSSLVQYIPLMKSVTLVRLLKQVSQVYETISFERLLELTHFGDRYGLERIIVDCVRHNDMQMRLDHRTSTVSFGTDLAEAQSCDLVEGPQLQEMPSEQIRTQLMTMHDVLERSLRVIQPEKIKSENQLLREKIVEAYNHSKARDRKRILERHDIIEKRKEYLEQLSMDREAEEQRKQEQQLREQQKQEAERLRLEREEREKRQMQEKMKQIQQHHINEKLQQIAQTDIGKKILDKMDEKEIAELDADQIMAKQVEELEKEKRELMNRLKAQEKKVDHIERAKRKEEIPMLEKTIEKDREEDRVLWKAKEAERIAEAVKLRKMEVQNRDRLSRMADDKTSFLDKVLKARKEEFEKKLVAFEAKCESEREKRLEERKRMRKEQRREKWRQEKEAEERKRKDEELLRQRQEKEKKEAEEMARKNEEYQKRKAELEAIAAKQRKREEEIEQRQMREREEAMAKTRDIMAVSGRGPQAQMAKADEDRQWRRDMPAAGGPDADRRRVIQLPRRDEPRRDDQRRDEGFNRDSMRRPEPRRDDMRRDDMRRDDRRGFGRDEPRREGGGGFSRDEMRRPEGRRDDFSRDDMRRGGNDSRGAGGRDDFRRGGGGDPRRDDFRRDDRPRAGGSAWGSGGGAGAGSWRSKDDRPRDGPRDNPRDGPRDSPRDGPRDMRRGQGQERRF